MERTAPDFLPISKHFALLEEQIDEDGHFMVNGSQEQRVWREEHEINEISLDGEWSGGEVTPSGLGQSQPEAKQILKKKRPDQDALNAATAAWISSSSMLRF